MTQERPGLCQGIGLLVEKTAVDPHLLSEEVSGWKGRHSKPEGIKGAQVKAGTALPRTWGSDELCLLGH